jgi:4-amino-4-deoxy-L-arabinose transferase-like glycosyltransferase
VRPARFYGLLFLLFTAAITLRALWLRSDPATVGSVGVVWHDEGAWVHNARNRAIWGVWRTDDWNPIFVAPVFTALEYGVFRVLGVGTWQARMVPVASGLLAVAALVVALRSIGGRSTALIGGSFLAANYPFVMWNRAALMESTMTALIAGAWAAYALSARRSAWGFAAGAAAVLAWFTKAAAAFFVAAIALDALWTLMSAHRAGTPRSARRAALLTLAGLAITTLGVALFFVLPNWSEYRFYNWQMSVLRKPEYSVRALVDRASWLPIAQDIFSRMWLVLAPGLLGIVAITGRWRVVQPGERLLVLWVILGLAELIIHDAGNARRYVMFIPALCALAAIVLTSVGREPDHPATTSVVPRAVALPLVMLLAYLAIGSLLRPLFATEVNAGRFATVVRLSAALATVTGVLAVWRWPRLMHRLDRLRVPAPALVGLVAVALGVDMAAYSSWAARRGEKNYEASVAVGRVLPPGTLVHGKLANGLALENRIRPLFVGNGFGNYQDRLRRDDARYLLTYDLPRIGYESSDGSGLIEEILGHYPRRAIVEQFEIDETPGPDRAVLFDKFAGTAAVSAAETRPSR